MRAFCAIRNQPVYRREAFARGLAACSYEVVFTDQHPGAPTPTSSDDALVIWNRYGTWHDLAVAFERKGCAVVVAENAYLANDRADRKRYALARDGHNGSGWWPLGGPERWQALGLEIRPWRAAGAGHVLVCPNRSFGRPGFVMPNDWAAQTAAKLRRFTDREVRVRPHPGNDPPKKPFAADLEGAHAVVIWSSSVGCEALLAGVPVFATAPWWICKSATKENLAEIETPRCYWWERKRAFERLAWAQWHVDEIETGEPFQHLLQRAPAFAGGV